MRRRLRTGDDRKGIPTIPWDQCIAKSAEDNSPGLTVLLHCRVVGAVAQVLLDILPPGTRALLPIDAILLAALHDVGKVSPGFQKEVLGRWVRDLSPALDRLGLGFCSDHTVVGASALWRHVGGPNTPAAALVAALHHGQARGQPSADDSGSTYGGANWAEQRRSLIEALVEEFGPIRSPVLNEVGMGLVLGLTSVADWIGSDEAVFNPRTVTLETDLPDLAQKAVLACGWGTPPLRPSLSFEDVFGNRPYPMQQQFADSVDAPGVYVLEAPTGIGKTEAALYAAYRLMARGMNQGLYFGLPTRLTSDKIHERVMPFLERVSSGRKPPKLAHGMAWLKAFEAHGGKALDAGGAWFNARKRTLLYPYAVGTIDQALLSAMRVKHHFVRLFGLAGKVVILDEVHSYDIYTGTLLDEMVQRLTQVGCTLIVLSATLTEGRRNQLLRVDDRKMSSTGYPLITACTSGGTVTTPSPPPDPLTYGIRVVAGDRFDVAADAAARAQAGQCVLCIANTVARAQAWYDAAKAACNEGTNVGLLHSKFPAFRRSELEGRWIDALGLSGERPSGCVLVATQVVEQSVDIDADMLITELAPTDMLLQRMGRVWRHSRADRPVERPEVVITAGDPTLAESVEDVFTAFGKTNCLVYAPYVLWRSYDVWQRRKKVVLPDDVRGLLEATYADGAKAMPSVAEEMRTELTAWREKMQKLAAAALSNVTALPAMADDDGVATRYSELRTTDVVLVRSVDDNERGEAEVVLIDGTTLHLSKWQRDIAATAALVLNTVSVATYVLERALGGVASPAWLAKHFAVPTPVLVVDADTGALVCNGQPTGLLYDAERGLRRALPQQTGGRAVSIPYDDHDHVDFLDKKRVDW